MGNMTPHREPAWALLAERARILARRCHQVAADRSHDAEPSAAIAGAAERAQAVAESLTAEVPDALRPPPAETPRGSRTVVASGGDRRQPCLAHVIGRVAV